MTSPLRAARASRNLSLKAVADAVATDPGNLSRVERGEQTPSKELAAALSQYFDNAVTEIQIIYPERFSENSATPARRAGDLTDAGTGL